MYTKTLSKDHAIKVTPKLQISAFRPQKHLQLNINLKAPYFISSLAAQDMIKNRREGVIINISSIASRGNSGQSVYSSSKAGLETLTKVWAQELGPFGIRCAAVAPGYIETNSTKKALKESIGERLRYAEISVFGPEYTKNGDMTVVGPSLYDRKWYATVTMENGIITKVK